MPYRDCFIDAVRAECPQDEAVVALLEGHDPDLGRVLFQAGNRRFKPEEIIRAVDEGMVDAIYEEALRALCRKELYPRWLAEYPSQEPVPVETVEETAARVRPENRPRLRAGSPTEKRC